MKCTLHPLTCDASHASAGREHFGSCIVADVCIHNPENNINKYELVPEEVHYYMVMSQQYGLELVNLCNLDF